MNKLVQLAIDLQEFFTQQNWEFCFIGGLAVQAWGEPRVTIDVDISLLTRFANEEKFIDALLAKFEPRIESAKEFALHNRVLLLKSNGIGIDIGLAGLPFEEEVIKESKIFKYLENSDLRIVSADNLIVMKAFANRPRDWLDISGIIIRQGELLNKKLIFERLTPLIELKGEPDILSELETMFNKKK